MSTFKRRWFACSQCGVQKDAFAWDYDPKPEHCGVAMFETGHGAPITHGVIDDQLEGGARWCETMGHEPVWLDGTKSQYRRLVERHNVVNVVKHDSAYYARQRRLHDEELRDTGRNKEY